MSAKKRVLIERVNTDGSGTLITSMLATKRHTHDVMIHIQCVLKMSLPDSELWESKRGEYIVYYPMMGGK